MASDVRRGDLGHEAEIRAFGGERTRADQTESAFFDPPNISLVADLAASSLCLARHRQATRSDAFAVRADVQIRATSP